MPPLKRTFRDFMEDVLYDPRSGYYGANRQVLTDFVTAPEIHLSFGSVLADDFARRFDFMLKAGIPGPYMLVEIGAGDGRLAQSVLGRLRESHPAVYARIQYLLVEKSLKFLKTALEKLSGFREKVSGYEDADSLPRLTGIVFSNELVDAFPVHLLEKRDGNIFEVYVSQPPHGDGLHVELGRLSRPELEPIAQGLRDVLEDGQRHAVNLEAIDWIQCMGRILQEGFLITIDYGKRYPGSSARTPRVFYRHRLADFIARPGKEDITASVDFEVLIREGELAGLALETYTTLGGYLLDRGILDHLPEGADLEAQKERVRIKTLFHPEGLGDSHKVLVQRKCDPSRTEAMTPETVALQEDDGHA